MHLSFGTLSNYSRGLVRVQLEELDNTETPWIPLLVKNAGADKSGSPIDFGTQVACIMDDEFEQGICLGCTYTDMSPCPTDSKDKEYHQFSDGTKIEYDRAASNLTISLAGGFNLMAADGSIDVPEIIINGTPLLSWLNGHEHPNGNNGANTGSPITKI